MQIISEQQLIPALKVSNLIQQSAALLSPEWDVLLARSEIAPGS